MERTTETEARHAIELSAAMTIAEVASARAAFDAALVSAGPSVCIEVRAAALRSFDTAGLQMLRAFASAVMERGGELCWLDVPEELARGFADAGWTEAAGIGATSTT